MRRFQLIAACAAAFVSSAAFAQTATETPPAPKAPAASTPTIQRPAATPVDRSLKGEARVHYLGKRLNFTTEQKATFDALLEVYRNTLQEEQANLAKILYEIRARVAEIQELERQGKHEQADAERREIDKLRPGKQALAEIMTNIQALLTPEQSADFDFLVDRMDRNKATLPISPMDVIEAATYAGADADQKGKLSKLENEFRERMNSTAAVDRDKVLDRFIHEVRDVLKADQQKKFDRRIEICKPEQLFVATGNPMDHIGTPVPKEDVKRPLGPAPATQPSNPK